MSSKAITVKEYLEGLPAERREAISRVREVILKNLPAGYEEGIQYGMIGYYIPLSRYPKTYNKQPLGLAALASQKNYMSLYLMNIYSDPETLQWFKDAFHKSGKKLDMGKSCIRFKHLEDLPLETVGQAIARTPVDDFITLYESSRNLMKDEGRKTKTQS
jgi:hypothetical protein